MAHTYIPNNRSTQTLEYPLVLQIMTILIYPLYPFFAKYTGDDEWNCRFYNLIADLAFEFHALYNKTEWETTSRDYMLHFVESRMNDLIDDYSIDREDTKSILTVLKNHPYYID